MSQIYLLHAVLPGMRDAGWGRFVHIGSATAKEPEGAIHHVIANATRPSTTGLLKTVADEYARYGITINTIAPGWIGPRTHDYLNAGRSPPTSRSATGCVCKPAPAAWAVPTRSPR
jgi:NAD(P)-dependent dehydrogenase (short-subunit alcohol dehydrogenase family)